MRTGPPPPPANLPPELPAPVGVAVVAGSALMGILLAILMAHPPSFKGRN